jgi:hypothetical protein
MFIFLICLVHDQGQKDYSLVHFVARKFVQGIIKIYVSVSMKNMGQFHLDHCFHQMNRSR